MKSSISRRLGFPILAVGLTLVAFLLCDPWGDFPLNDDWQYGLAASRFADTGQVELLPYTAMTLVGQAVAGGLVWRLSPGFPALRILTLLFACAGALAAWWIGREVGLKRRQSFLLSATALACPLTVNLSTTFMTDVPFLALWLLSLAAFLRALNRTSCTWVVVGSLFAAAAFSIRQIGVLPPLAFLLLIGIRHRSQPLRLGLTAAIASFAFAGPILTWYFWSHGPTDAYRYKAAAPLHESLPFLPGGLWITLVYLALFLTPILLCAIPRPRSRRGGLLPLSILVLAAFALAHAKWGLLPGIAKTMPYVRGVAYNAGLGPITLTDAREESYAFASVAGPWQVALSVLGGALVPILLHGVIRGVRRTALGPPLLLGLVAAIYTGAALTTTRVHAPLMDRYLLPILVPVGALLLAAATHVRRSSHLCAWIIIGAFLAFGVVATRDYHAWNSARWQLCSRAEDAGADPTLIDGGFEYSGWHNAEAFYDGRFKRPEGWKGWWVVDPVYLVAAHPRAGYDEVAGRTVSLWLGLGKARILLLRRRPPPTPNR